MMDVAEPETYQSSTILNKICVECWYQLRRFPGKGLDPPKDMHWRGSKSKGPPMSMSLFSVYHGY